ncbi:MAG: hypothetical protein ACI93R_000201 [Flavobacteriales bacterium]
MPALSSFCAGALIAMAIFYLNFVDSAQVRHETLALEYGQSLVNSAAELAEQASFDEKLLSLRVIVQDMTANPHVLTASIHNVENQLLAQAGNRAEQRKQKHQVFTAEITVQETISGYVTATLAPSSLFHASQFIIFSLSYLLFIALGLWALLNNKTFSLTLPALTMITKRPRNNAEDETTIDATTEAAGPLEPIEKVETECNYAYAAVCVKNIAVLQQQLDGETFRSIFNLIEKLIEDISLLYDGHSWTWESDRYLIRFRSLDEKHGALFQAACSAYLLLDIAAIIKQIPLDLSAQIANNEGDLASCNMPYVGLAVTGEDAASTELQNRVRYVDLGMNDGRQIISKFESTYAALLEKQAEQLKA